MNTLKDFIKNLSMNDYILIGLVVAFIIILIILIVVVIKNSKKNVHKKIDEVTRELKLEELQKGNKPEVSIEKKEEPKEEKIDLESITKSMEKVVESGKPPVQNYEEEQEAAAIISYDELLDAVKIEEPVAKQQPVVEQPIQQPIQQPVVEQPIQQPVVEQPIQQPVVEQPIQQSVEKTPVVEESIEELNIESNEFLDDLKNLRKNL